MVNKPLTRAGRVLFCLISLTAPLLAADQFFTPPEAPFVVSTNEQVVRVILTSTNGDNPGLLGGLLGRKTERALPAEEAQAAIDEARTANPDAFLLIEAQDPVRVGDKPLKLRSRMNLMLGPGPGITAAPEAKAECLIEIADAEMVAVTSAGPGVSFIDGGGQNLAGISVTGGSRINLDQLAVTRCGKTGIGYRGKDDKALNQGASVTRCHFLGNGDGLTVESAGGFQCLDNEFKNQTGTAININSMNSMVAGNEFDGNKTDIRSSSDRGVIARNVFGSSDLALDLTSTSKGNLVTENRSGPHTVTFSVAGETNQLFGNTAAATVKPAAEAKDIFLIANRHLEVDPTSSNVKFFNPPTLNNPHTNPVIVAGMGRFDLTVPGGKKVPSTPETKDKPPKIVPVELSVVEAELAKAQAEHPNDVIVIHLEGEYVVRSPKGLELPPNSCLLMAPDARILADHGIAIEPPWERAAEVTQVILLPKTGYSSISGGKIDAGRQAFFPINANTGSVAVIEGTCVVGGARDGINTKTRKATDPLFVYQCNVYGNAGRGIWSHVATRVHSIANVCSGNYMDGIDLDAHAVDCTALFNVSNGNRRHGVFIEEATLGLIVFGNRLEDNGGSGVHVWNEEVKGSTGPNVISANVCRGNRRGVSTGGRDDDKTADANLFFNNVCRANREDGILSGNSKAKENYFSQIVVGENFKKDINDPTGAAAIFFSTVNPKAP